MLIVALLGSVQCVSRFVESFHPISYDALQVERQHRQVRDEFTQRRRRRSLTEGPRVFLEFHHQQKHFKLELHGDDEAFHPDHEVEDNEGHSLAHRLDHLVAGRIVDQPGSFCHGQLRHGVFSGTIYSPQWGAFYVENNRDKKGVTHSIIYHEDQIKMPESSCIEMHHQPPPIDLNNTFHATSHAHHDMFTRPMGTHYERLRKRRDAGDDLDEEQENTCILRIQVDHMFTSDERFQAQDSCKITESGRRRCKVDRDEVISFISSHVRAINQIYIGSSFVVTKGGKQLKIRPRFQVRRIKIDETTDDKDAFRSRNIGVEKFLEKASLNNYDDYCLAYVFTKRDFQNGVLGLAWVAQPEGNSGGICEKNKKYTDGVSKSLNTGIITIENYGSVVPEKVSHITFAHEIGHNFGSPHDDISCSPGESSDPAKREAGNFIMYSRATAGDKANNDKFSPCSYGNITAVLQRKRKCFVSSDAPICGNQIVDQNEECDCGFTEDCANVGDKCCYPADHVDVRKRCKRRNDPRTNRKYQCSPSEGPCCQGETCSFKTSDYICSKDLDCTHEQGCDGKQARCPKPKQKDNYIMCHKDTMVCVNGQCSGSICLHYSGILEPCECDVNEEEATEEEKKKNCHVCCKHKDTGVCKSTGELSEYFSRVNEETGVRENRTIFRQPGSPCNNYEGYCDVFSKCRQVDADGPLARLKKALFDPVLYYSIREWIVEYWWAVLLMALALVMLMGAFIKICSLHTKSDNPNMVPHRDFPGTETLRRLHRQSGRGRNYQANQHVQLNHYHGAQQRHRT